MSSPGNRVIDMMIDAINEPQEPASSVAVALADKVAARARRELERQQDWQCFIRQESARIFCAIVSADGADARHNTGSYTAKCAVEFAQNLWDALPEGCKL